MKTQVSEMHTEVYPFENDLHSITVHHPSKWGGRTSPATVNWATWCCDNTDDVRRYAEGIIFAANLADEMNAKKETI